ncbi:glycosyltransferase [Plantibacter sp. ME-Dv--P-122b]|uniref:glycosyltransferase n=1 Tax=Plantibacter sp. ME-Dv--P-122b TaxID=3040300 RepID=UPI00254EE1C3|nr:glycosyltransferase [Plantibacter sp. ME-Dv--P-122b]
MTQKPIARYYRGARTTHLERLHDSAPGDFFYQKPMYDFDMTRAPAGVRVEQTSFAHIATLVLKGTYSRLEIVEPYAPSALPQNLIISAAARIGRLFHRQPTQLVTYAIENADLPRKVASSTHLPVAVTRALLRLTVGFCYRSLTRVVFGTADAETNYEALLGARMKRRPPETTLIWGLPTAHPSALVGEGDKPASKVLFVGALDERKGIRQLMDSWSDVLAASPDAELQILGKGPLEAEVLSWAQTAPRTTVIIDPARDIIFEAQRQADVAVLLSQPFTNWKEQIGLPIVEGLSVGTEIIASSETGIADWLENHGHRVLAPQAPRGELTRAVVDALRSRRARSAVLADLPQVDGRFAADRWLFVRSI